MDPTVSVAERGILIQRLKAKDAVRVVGVTQQRLLRRRNVAELLGLSLRTVDKLAKEGSLEKVRLPGRVRGAGFRETDVNVLLNAGQKEQVVCPD